MAARGGLCSSRPQRPQPPLLYLGSCQPRCDAAVSNDVWLPTGLLHGGRCHAYCTHAYALSRERASTFFADVFGCQNGSSSSCGEECEFRPCFMDWAMTRYFKARDRMDCRWRPSRAMGTESSRAIHTEPRSAALGNAVSGGTSLAKRFRWANDSTIVEQQQRCERGVKQRPSFLSSFLGQGLSSAADADAAAEGGHYDPVERTAWQPPLRAGYACGDGQASQRRPLQTLRR